MERQIRDCLENIRPYILSDGGDLEFVGIEAEGVVLIRFLGALGDSERYHGFLDDIEARLKDEVPGVKAVRAVD